MDKKQIKKAIGKNLKVAEKKGKVVKADALKKYAAVKKDAIKKGGELEAIAMKEYEKIKKQMDTTSKKVEAYVKKNPEKVAAISAGIGMALGAVAGILATHGKGKKKKK